MAVVSLGFLSRKLFRTLRGRIFLWFIAIVAALSIAAAVGFARLTAYIGDNARSEMEDRIEQIITSMESSNTLYYNLVSSSMKVFSLLAGEEGPANVSGSGKDGVPLLFFGKRPVNGDNDLVDNVSRLMGGTATIFSRDGERFVRVATSVRDASGKRAIGTCLETGSEVTNALLRGIPYTGINDILGRPYYTSYTPLKDPKGKVVGALYAGYDMQALEPLREAIEPHSVLEKGFLALIDGKGRVILRTREDDMHIFDEDAIAKSAIRGGFSDPDWAISVRPYSRWHYSVVGGLHLPDVRSLAWTFGVEMVAVLSLVLATVLGVSFWLSSRLSRTMDLLRDSNETLEAARKRLAGELDEAANYVRSLLPDPIKSPYAVDWCFEPSTELGGDAFGYHWVDQEHLVIYLLDVCGHGVGAALFSAAAITMIRAGALSADLRDPGAVLSELNERFPMDRNNGMYFTAWFGVFHAPTRTLRHSCGGHPPALLMAPEGGVREIREPSMIVGLMPDTAYKTGSLVVEQGSRLFIFSDGVYEATKPDNSLLDFEEFKEFIAANGREPDAFERLKEWIHSIQGPGPFADDFTMVRVYFP
jgi:phosphoserine phosphatase RsbU/P